MTPTGKDKPVDVTINDQTVIQTANGKTLALKELKTGDGLGIVHTGGLASKIVVNVKPDDIRVSSPYSDFALYDDSVVVGFSMPGIEDDCIIDYTWREVTKPILMPGRISLAPHSASRESSRGR